MLASAWSPEARAPAGGFPKHLLAIEGLARADAEAILALGERFLAGGPMPPTLRGRAVLTAFFEASTRTRTSFEMAARGLGGQVLSLTPAVSSVTKGETLLDSVRTLEAMGADVVVVRHASSGAAEFLARKVRASVVNAGDGAHEHPTQALLDALTVRRRLGRLEGLTVAICGDVLHSRVARSGARLFALLGARVRFCGPPTLLPPAAAEAFGVEVFERLDAAVAGADVVMGLRVQRERLAGAFLPSLEDYARGWRLDRERLARLAPRALVLHPGPMNRGVEIEGALADAPESAVLEQVRAGVAVRAAVLHLLGAAGAPPS
ncbi:MAG TPA: aspartate carbamoyltransferase catalytic subunit [Polyangiaceae bacterium]|nr:aspartate carbamoyltransferase catalytic subunit [Polyangiaceae bacterium]